jgi:hypothetical protein
MAPFIVDLLDARHVFGGSRLAELDALAHGQLHARDLHGSHHAVLLFGSLEAVLKRLRQVDRRTCVGLGRRHRL